MEIPTTRRTMPMMRAAGDWFVEWVRKERAESRIRANPNRAMPYPAVLFFFT